MYIIAGFTIQIRRTVKIEYYYKKNGPCIERQQWYIGTARKYRSPRGFTVFLRCYGSRPREEEAGYFVPVRDQERKRAVTLFQQSNRPLALLFANRNKNEKTIPP